MSFPEHVDAALNWSELVKHRVTALPFACISSASGHRLRLCKWRLMVTVTNTHTHTHTHTRARAHARTHAHARTRTHARTHTHTHTQRVTLRLLQVLPTVTDSGYLQLTFGSQNHYPQRVWLWGRLQILMSYICASHPVLLIGLNVMG